MWVSSIGPGQGLTVLGGYASVDAIASGALTYLPVRLSRVPRLLSGTIVPEVAVVRARAAGHGFRLSSSVGWALPALRHARRVVVEVDESGPLIETPEVPARDVLAVASTTPAYVPPRPLLDDASRRIGELVAALVPHGATLQYGPGAIAEAVVAALDRPVSVWSGLVSDALVDLSDRGLLVGRATAAYLWGGPRLDEMAAAGLVRLAGVEETHDVGTLSRIDGFVGVNTALEVGLDGSVNIERVGPRMVAGIGGHADYCQAAASSTGGLSIIALRASRDGCSAIVPVVQHVSTARSEVEMVVTENGVADLRGLGDNARARALLAIADPACREELERAVAAMS